MLGELVGEWIVQLRDKGLTLRLIHNQSAMSRVKTFFAFARDHAQRDKSRANSRVCAWSRLFAQLHGKSHTLACNSDQTVLARST